MHRKTLLTHENELVNLQAQIKAHQKNMQFLIATMCNVHPGHNLTKEFYKSEAEKEQQFISTLLNLCKQIKKLRGEVALLQAEVV